MSLRIPRPVAPAFDMVYWMAAYFRVFGRSPNLACPRTFSEHIARKNLFDRRPLLTTLADKYAVRQYVRERVGNAHLPQVYLVSDDPREIDLAVLPDRFAVKATHGSGWTIFVLDKQHADMQEIRRTCAGWLATNYYDMKREWAYRDIKPRIMVEEFLGDACGVAPIDYKFFCFHGVARVVQVDVGRFRQWTSDYYDRDWRRMALWQNVSKLPDALPRPKSLERMIGVAEKLAAGLDFLRVDLYDVAGRVVFGEMTNYPWRGLYRFEPEEWDAVLGSFWCAGPGGGQMPPARLMAVPYHSVRSASEGN